jgi:hypothetical protein
MILATSFITMCGLWKLLSRVIGNSSRGDEEEEDEDFKSKKEEENEFSFASSTTTTFKGDNNSITSFSSIVSSVQDVAAVEEFEYSYSPTKNLNENSTNSHFLKRNNLSGGSFHSHLATNSFSNLDEPKDPLK